MFILGFLLWAFIRCDQITYRKFLRHFYSTATHFLTPDPITTSFVSCKFMQLDQGSSLVKATPSPYLSLRFSTPSFQSYCLGFTGFGQLDPGPLFPQVEVHTQAVITIPAQARIIILCPSFQNKLRAEMQLKL